MFTLGASSAFRAADDVAPPPAMHPRRLPAKQTRTDRSFLTFVLTHVFVLPGAAEQHQPHSPADTELRVVSRAKPNEASQPPQGRRNTGVSAHQSSLLLLFFPLRHRQPTRSFLQHFPAARHSRGAPTNDRDAGVGAGKVQLCQSEAAALN